MFIRAARHPPERSDPLEVRHPAQQLLLRMQRAATANPGDAEPSESRPLARIEPSTRASEQVTVFVHAHGDRSHVPGLGTKTSLTHLFSEGTKILRPVCGVRCHAIT